MVFALDEQAVYTFIEGSEVEKRPLTWDKTKFDNKYYLDKNYEKKYTYDNSYKPTKVQ